VLGGDDARSRRRSQAFCTAARAHGQAAATALEVPAPTTLGMGRQALGRLLQQAPDTDALFCSSDLLALGVLTEARARGWPCRGSWR
jgi:LacI family gluconate utilization system Gnt-I transcriptional repressor